MNACASNMTKGFCKILVGRTVEVSFISGLLQAKDVVNYFDTGRYCPKFNICVFRKTFYSDQSEAVRAFQSFTDKP